MLKNIQKYLLLNYPLLWNTKIVPLSILLVLLNLIFFAIGFKNGEIDFTETNNNYNYNESEPILIFIGVLISAMIIIIWLVYYFKNNAFKSFYPNENFGLFKEWLIIFSVAFLTALFSVSYYYAKEAQQEVFLIIANCEPMQKKWASENKLNYSTTNWAEEIALAQVKKIKPDVFFIESIFLISKRTIFSCI